MAGKMLTTGAVLSFLCGLAIAVTVEATAGKIATNKKAWIDEAIRRITPLDSLQAIHEENSAGSLFRAEGAQKSLWVVRTRGQGFNEHIEFLYCYDPELKKVCGFTVTDHRETPGLGDKITSDTAFTGSLTGLKIQTGPTGEPLPFRLEGQRPGDGEFAAATVDGITGATISSKAVVRILNQSLRENYQRLKNTPPTKPNTASDTDKTDNPDNAAKGDKGAP